MIRAAKRRIDRQVEDLQKKGHTTTNLSHFLISPPSTTNESNEKCYARCLNSCSGNLTREHFISRNVLSKIDRIDPSGIPWLSHLKNDLNPDYFMTKTLCERHNNWLSPLDTFAGEAFQFLKEFGSKNNEDVIIWGPTLERWFLKVFCGLVSTRQIQDSRGTLTIGDISEQHVRILFGHEEMPHNTGLFSANFVGDKVATGLNFTLLNLSDLLKGMKVSFGSLEFIFSLEPKEISFNKNDSRYDYVIHHPQKYIWEENKSSVQLHW